MTPCVLFEVAGTTYIVPAEDVHMVDMIERIVPVPHAPAFVDGLAYLRGSVVPVVNLRKRFGFEPIPYDLSSRLVVVRHEDRLIALAADTAREFRSLDLSALAPVPPTIAAAGNEAVRGVLSLNGRILLLIDPHGLVSPKDINLEGAQIQ